VIATDRTLFSSFLHKYAPLRIFLFDYSVLTEFLYFCREHVPERVFAHELQVNTEVTSSYRYVVRSFRTGAALLQLVLLNQDASVCIGTCHTESSSDSQSRAQCISGKTNQVFGSRLDAVARFMFRDCRNLDKDQLG
jgi:hypothetical protein